MIIRFPLKNALYPAICTLLLLGIPWILPAQFYIAPGATVTLDGTSMLTAQNLNFTNVGTLSMGSGSTLRMQGTQDQQLTTGGASLQTLEISKGSGKVYLQDNCQLTTGLSFSILGGWMVLGTHNLIFGSAATVTGYASYACLVTDNTGVVTKQALNTTSFTFPVANDLLTYNPLTLSENGTADDISVRCMASPLANGSSGTALLADAVDASWEVSEAVVGGSSLSTTAQWAGTDELSGFNAADCGIARYNTGTDWDLPPTNMGAASGSNPYLRTRTGMSPGIWMVADEAFMNRVLISAKIMLLGPFNSATSKMNDNLRSLAAFPTTAPATYSTGKFVPTGWQPIAGFSIDPSVLTVTGDDAIVDWVFMSLRDPALPSVLTQTRVALLQKDGDVVELDGVSPVKMPGNATENYILGIGHRNHLSVRTPNGSGLAFSESTNTAYDFTTASTQAYGTNPMQQVQYSPTSIYALWGGNANENTTIRATGPSSVNDYSTILTVLEISNILSSVYSKADLNLDGTVRATGPSSVNDYSRLLNYLGTNTIITEQN